MEATYVLEIANEQKIKNVIQTLMQKSGLQEGAIKIVNLSYKGHTINSVAPTGEAAQVGPVLHWVFANQHLIAGADMETIKSSIDVMRSEKENFLASPQLRRARDAALAQAQAAEGQGLLSTADEARERGAEWPPPRPRAP